MLGTLKSSGSPSPLRRRAEYLVLNKRSKISTGFRLWKILIRIYLELHMTLRCFDTVFRRPYRKFFIALKEILSLSDSYKIFASDWLWIEVCQNGVLTKIDITMTTINKTIGNRSKPNFSQSRPATKNPTLGT